MTTISIRLDDADKKELESLCAEMGMNVTTFFTICAKKTLRERRIPFEVTAEPRFSEPHLARLRKADQQYRSGQVVIKSMEELETLADE